MKFAVSGKTRVSLVIIVFLLAAAGWGVWLVWQRGQSLAIRNVILISIDTCRADRLSCYGYPLNTTPQIDAIAQEGVLFEKVISPVATTLPAHGSMLTGTIPPYHGVHDNIGDILGDSSVTLAEMLKENGFATAAFVSTRVLDSEVGIKQGFDLYDDDLGDERNATGLVERIAEKTNAPALNWLEQHHKEEFFLFLHYYDPHFPYEPPEAFESKMRAAFTDAKLDLDEPQKERVDIAIRYAAEIAYVDHGIGQVVEKLKRLGLYESALIIVTADHGESLYEHKEITHAYYTYQSTIAVPLIVKLPGGPQDRRIAERVGLVDIVPTVCSLLDIAPPAVLHGKDLSEHFSLSDAALPERSLYAESFLPMQYLCNPLVAVVNNRYKYIHTNAPELYDLDTDPDELDNVIKEHPKRARRMFGQLKDILLDAHQEQDSSQQTVSAERLAQLESLGYVSGGQQTVSYEFDPSKADAKSRIDYHLDLDKGIYLKTNKQVDQAKAVFRRLIAEQPQLSIGYLKLAALAKEQGNIKECASLYQKIIELRPNYVTAYYELGQAYVSLGEPDRAIAVYHKGLEVDKNDLSLISSLADAYYTQRNFEKAAVYYQAAVNLKPDFVDVNLLLGSAFFKLGRIDSAITQFRRVLDLDQKSFAATHALANIYYRQKDLDRAVATYKNALELQPDSIEVMGKLAQISVQTDQVSSAVLYYHAILEVDDSHLRALNDLAWIQATSGDSNIRDPENAVLLAKKACEISDYKLPAVLGTLAAAYAASDQFDQAVATAEKALELAKAGGKTELTEKLQSSLKRYKNNLSY